MEKISERAYAKLNLSLDVLSKRSDGYHDMRMVMQTVSLYDELTISPRRDGSITVRSNLHYLPCDQRNIAYKAARAFFAALGRSDLGADITIKKHIPVCAGTGGGSADGAAVLRGLNTLCGRPFTFSQLEDIGLSCGSDIPFCIGGGTALAEGRGEKLTDIGCIPPCHIVLCKPRVSISTPKLFERIDAATVKFRPDTTGIIRSIQEGNLRAMCTRMYNVFEDVLPKSCSEVPVLKSLLLEAGALGAIMTGTGSAVFGVFQSLQSAEAARAALSSKCPEVFLCTPVEKQNLQ